MVYLLSTPPGEGGGLLVASAPRPRIALSPDTFYMTLDSELFILHCFRTFPTGPVVFCLYALSSTLDSIPTGCSRPTRDMILHHCHSALLSHEGIFPCSLSVFTLDDTPSTEIAQLLTQRTPLDMRPSRVRTTPSWVASPARTHVKKPISRTETRQSRRCHCSRYAFPPRRVSCGCRLKSLWPLLIAPLSFTPSWQCGLWQWLLP